MHLRHFFCWSAAFVLFSAVAWGTEWQTDYEQALAAAKESKKPVLLNFTGSDWCGPCIAQHRNVFAKPAFAEFAQKNLVLVELDMPQRKKLSPKTLEQNERLRHQHGVQSLPTLVLLDPDGKVLGKLQGYAGEGPTEMIASIEKLIGKTH